MKFYVIGDGNNFYEGMTKEQIYAAIIEAIQTGSIGDIDAGFVTKVKEINHNTTLSFWAGTEAEFNAIEEKQQNVLYIKTDDSTLEAIQEQFELYSQWFSNIDEYFTSVTNSIDQDSDTEHIVNENFSNYELTAQKTGNVVSVVGKSFASGAHFNQRDTMFTIDALLYGAETEAKNLQPVGDYLIFPIFDMQDNERIGYGEVSILADGKTKVEYYLYSPLPQTFEFNFNFTYLIKAGA